MDMNSARSAKSEQKAMNLRIAFDRMRAQMRLTTPSSATAERGAARAQPWNERQTPKCRCRSARRKHAP